MDTSLDKLSVLCGRLFGQNFQRHRLAAPVAGPPKQFCPATVHRGRGQRTKRRTSWTRIWTKMADRRTDRTAHRFVPSPYIVATALDKISYFMDAPAGQKSSTQTYPQPLPWHLSEPYFVDARPYIIPSEPYIVPSMPYIVAKSIRQPSESIAVRVPKTSIKLRKPIKTPAGRSQFGFEDSQGHTLCLSASPCRSEWALRCVFEVRIYADRPPEERLPQRAPAEPHTFAQMRNCCDRLIAHRRAGRPASPWPPNGSAAHSKRSCERPRPPVTA